MRTLEVRNEQINRQAHRYEREFLDTQVRGARKDLFAAEDSLQRFYERNVVIRSPDLKLEESRRLRGIELAQQIYADLVLRSASVRQEEAKNSPQLLMVDPGTIPPDKTLLVRLILSVLAGLLLCCLYAGISWLNEYTERANPVAVSAHLPERHARVTSR